MRIDEHLSEAIQWAEQRLRHGEEPPFIYYRLMQLREAAMELAPHAKRLAEDSPGSEEHPETDAQQVVSLFPPSTVPRRPPEGR